MDYDIDELLKELESDNAMKLAFYVPAGLIVSARRGDMTVSQWLSIFDRFSAHWCERPIGMKPCTAHDYDSEGYPHARDIRYAHASRAAIYEFKEFLEWIMKLVPEKGEPRLMYVAEKFRLQSRVEMMVKANAETPLSQLVWSDSEWTVPGDQ